MTAAPSMSVPYCGAQSQGEPGPQGMAVTDGAQDSVE